MHQHIAGTLADSLIEHKECQWQHEIVVLDEQGRLVAKPCTYRYAASPVDGGKQQKTDKRHYQRPEEESVILSALLFMKIRVETNDAGARTQLRQPHKEHRRINQHSCQPDFLGSEETG